MGFCDCRWGWNESNMNPWDRFRLSPFQKWRYYRLPPWKFLLNVLLILCTTTQIYLINAFITPYYRSQIQNWQSYLPLRHLEKDTTFSMTEFWIFKVDDVVGQVTYTVNQYYDLNATSVEKYDYFTNETGAILPVECDIEFYKGEGTIFDPTTKMNREVSRAKYNLTKADLGPFGKQGSELKDFVHTMRQFTLRFRVKTEGKGSTTCWVNKVEQHFDFVDRGRIDMKVQPDLVLCQEEMKKKLVDRDIFPVFVTFVVLFILSTASQVLLFKAICNHMKLYQHFKANILSDRWEDLSCKSKMKFFNFWFFITTSGNVANIVSSLTAYNFFVDYSRYQWDVIILLTGFGCMMCWISIMQFLEHFPKYYYLILTLRLSTPRLAKFLIGVMPVFLGFTFFGVAYFAAFSDLFKDTGSAAVTLFALLNGDVIHDVFDDIYDASPFISRLYLYLFIMLFIYAVLNIFIAIVEDAFFAAKRIFVEGLTKNLADRQKSPEDMDILGLLDGPPVAFQKTSNNENVANYPSMSFIGRQTMLNIRGDLARTGQTMPEVPSTIIEEEEFELTTSDQLTNQDIVQTLSDFNKSFHTELLEEIRALVQENQEYLRPPHGAQYFPCGSEDCIYCRVKNLFVKHLENMKQQTAEEFKLVRAFRAETDRFHRRTRGNSDSTMTSSFVSLDDGGLKALIGNENDADVASDLLITPEIKAKQN